MNPFTLLILHKYNIMLVSKFIYYDEKNILPSAHQVKIIVLNF
jgi:hypothetical protein